MNNSFEPAFKALIEWEGGYVNDPNDPGGETKYGISKRSYPKVNISKLTLDKAKKIYRRDYWGPVGGDDLQAGLDLFMFDTAVNCGVDQALMFLQRVAGTKDDGIWGPKTKAAVQKSDVQTTLWEVVARRGIFYQDLSTWDDYGLGWMRRLADMHQRAVRLIK